MGKEISRRTFLKVVAGAAAASGLSPQVRRIALEPFVRPPEEGLPGRATWFASTCRQCPAGCGIIVRVINGRARKIEGNPNHPLNRGKLCARGQAGLQVLYNPDRLHNAVRQSAGRGSMPAWQSRLSQDERWDVIDYLRTFTYDPTLTEEVVSVGPQAPTKTPAACNPGQENPLAWEDLTAIETGQVTYQAQCVLCHGQDGSGGLPNTPDFTSGEAQDKLHESPGNFYCAISEGVGAMPSFGNQLSQESQWQVITYLGSLAP